MERVKRFKEYVNEKEQEDFTEDGQNKPEERNKSNEEKKITEPTIQPEIKEEIKKIKKEVEKENSWYGKHKLDENPPVMTRDI